MTTTTQPPGNPDDLLAWRHSAAGQTYVLHAAPYRCLVWHTLRGTWGAVVIGPGASVADYTFATPAEAQTWCEARVAARVDLVPGGAGARATGTPAAAPPWHYRAVDGNYTWGHGRTHCRVWRTAADAWHAVVSHPGRAKRTQTFASREQAQAWCAAHVSGTTRVN